MSDGKLTPKQGRFVEEYLVDFNATQAAIRAGYSRKTAYRIGFENLRKHQIQEAVAARAQALADTAEVTSEKVLAELALIGFSDVKTYVRWDEGSAVIIPSDELPPGASRAISEISIERITRSDEEGCETTQQKIKFKTWNKNQALEKLGQWLKLFTDKHEFTGQDGRSLGEELVEAFLKAKERAHGG